MFELMAHVIDDDDGARESLAFLLSTSGISVQTYPSASAFLAVASEAKGVVVTDIRMPQMDGLEFIRRLRASGIGLPVIVMTGHGGVPLAVEAMKAGALDFIEKPFDDAILLDAIRTALADLDRSYSEESQREETQRRIRSLSRRERQVLDGLVAGRPNKLIADGLGLSARTVEVYRATMVTKMQARSLSELVRMALLAGVAS
jgi:two-component system, LuxR family, response regulator FixJ